MTRAVSAATLVPMSLAELLVALALLGLTLSGLLLALEQGQQAYAIGAARVEAQQDGRIAVERLAREIRGAGAGGRGFAAISIAEPQRIVLHLDKSGDGVINQRGETITWRLTGTVLRRDAGGGAQPVTNGVQGLALDYRDARGQPTQVPGEVRTVGITLTTAAETGAGATTFTTEVRLRNR